MPLSRRPFLGGFFMNDGPNWSMIGRWAIGLLVVLLAWLAQDMWQRIDELERHQRTCFTIEEFCALSPSSPFCLDAIRIPPS